MLLRSISFIVLGTQLVAAQATEKNRAPGASITGIVYDSIAGAPLAGANVQLAAADSLGRFSGGAVSDSLGRFAIDGVPNGRYLIGFLHPMLDSLGLQPTLRAVTVVDARTVHTVWPFRRPRASARRSADRKRHPTRVDSSSASCTMLATTKRLPASPSQVNGSSSPSPPADLFEKPRASSRRPATTAGSPSATYRARAR